MKATNVQGPQIGPYAFNDVLLKLGYQRLNPMQRDAIKQRILEARRVLIVAPTASGKTLLALLAIIKNFLEKGSKALYIVPLRALATDKYLEFRDALAPFGASVAISTGDFDSSSDHLAHYDVIVVTSEKLDSLFRHRAAWLKSVELAVVDEGHVLNDEERGPTLEIVITRLLKQGLALFMLSASIPNGDEVANWLGAKLFTSDWRPVPLHIGILAGDSLYLRGLRETLKEKRALERCAELVKRCIGGKKGRVGQALIFVATRRAAEALARKLAPVVKSFLSESENAALQKVAKKVLGLAPTTQCRELSKCILSGVAFHHAGLKGSQRLAIEEAFKKRQALKLIVCTTTLAMGIDYPASWVIVRDIKRFTGLGSEYIPKLEIQQMLGRAGRPRYDDEGIGILTCQPYERKAVERKYILGPLEKIYSKLSSEPALRHQILALFATRECESESELLAFIEATFFAHQWRGAKELRGRVASLLGWLERNGFLRRVGGRIVATPIGRRVSELYIDPLSACEILKLVESARLRSLRDIDFLYTFASATEARPLVAVKRVEEQALFEEAAALSLDVTHIDALPRYKTAKLFNAWINEASEQEILSAFDTPPGVLHARVVNAEWLAYATAELARMLNASLVERCARLLERRLHHGVKEELLELCRLRGIGRVRARRLWSAGIRSVADYKAMPRHRIKAIIGEGVEVEEVEGVEARIESKDEAKAGAIEGA